MVFIRKAELPLAIRGFVMPDVDGNYNIYVNDKLSEERKLLTIQHEIQHIQNNDCYSYCNVCDIEKNALEGCTYGKRNISENI